MTTFTSTLSALLNTIAVADDSSEVLYTSWESGQPGSGDCIAVNTATGKWKAAPCTTSYNALCSGNLPLFYELLIDWLIAYFLTSLVVQSSAKETEHIC